MKEQILWTRGLKIHGAKRNSWYFCLHELKQLIGVTNGEDNVFISLF